MKTGNKLLNSQVSVNIITLRNCKAKEIILKEQIVKLREEIAMSESNRQTFRCLFEATSSQMEYTQSHSEHYDNNCKEAFSQQHNYSDNSVRFPVAQVRTRQTRNRNVRILDQRTENGQAVIQLSFMDFQSLVSAVGIVT